MNFQSEMQLFSSRRKYYLFKQVGQFKKTKKFFIFLSTTFLPRTSASLKTRYIKIKVEHYLFFIVQPSKNKLDCLRNKIHLFTFIFCFLQRVSRQAKFTYGGLILSSSQFLLLPQLPQKKKLASKVVKVDSKIIVLLRKI